VSVASAWVISRAWSRCSIVIGVPADRRPNKAGYRLAVESPPMPHVAVDPDAVAAAHRPAAVFTG
jgi:hypothetical protein